MTDEVKTPSQINPWRIAKFITVLFALIGAWFVGYVIGVPTIILLLVLAYILIKSLSRTRTMVETKAYGQTHNPLTVFWLIAAIFAIVIGFFILTDILVVIPPGFVGVEYSAFSGVNMEKVRYPGWSLKLPIVQKVYQVQTARDTINFYTGTAMGEAAPADDVALSVPSSDGLIITVDVSVMYRTKPEKAPYIIQNLGEWYRSYTVMPQIRSAMREITGTMKAEELYGPGREKLQREAFTLLASKLERDGFVVEDILIRDIDLPPDFLKSIEAKKIMEQDAIRKQNELKLAEFEAQRKKTEAEGIANYKIEVARGDAESLRLVAKVIEENSKVLEFKKLEITEKLYQNPNTRFIALPSNEMILSLPVEVIPPMTTENKISQ